MRRRSPTRTPARGPRVTSVLSAVFFVLTTVACAGLFVIATSATADAQTDSDPVTVVDCDAPATDDDTLRIATKALEPFVFVDDEELRGFSIDYWTEVAGRIGATTEWCVAETVGDIIDLASTEQADAAIAGISITSDREAIIDFSQPYYTSGQQIVTATGGASTARTLFGLIFSQAFLFPVSILILLVLVVSHLVWWFERGHDSDDFPYEYRHGIGEAIWWSTVSVITGGEAVKNINTALSRLIAVFWMLVGLFLLAFVTARATSLLTIAELESDISGIEDLAGRSVSTVEGTATVDFLRTEARLEPRQAETLAAALDDLEAGETDAVVFDAPVIQYEIASSNRDLQLVEPTLGRDPYGIAMPQGSPLVEPVNAAVIEIGRDGTLDELLAEWFGDS